MPSHCAIVTHDSSIGCVGLATSLMLMPGTCRPPWRGPGGQHESQPLVALNAQCCSTWARFHSLAPAAAKRPLLRALPCVALHMRRAPARGAHCHACVLAALLTGCSGAHVGTPQLPLAPIRGSETRSTISSSKGALHIIKPEVEAGSKGGGTAFAPPRLPARDASGVCWHAGRARTG